MEYNKNTFGLTLSGGGVKGYAYIGVFEASEERGIKWGNMAGVSSGALAISINAAGYNSLQFQNVINTLDYKSLQISDASNLPIVNRYREYLAQERTTEEIAAFRMLNSFPGVIAADASEMYRGNILKNIITFSKEKALFDGDYLEEWLYGVLAKKGIRTFGDLKGGIADKKNPNGYKIRMTAVDCIRLKSIILPDDLVYYGIEPDNFEVAKAVRISTSIPFAFKPVIIKKDGVNHYLIDGGVFDNFPFWLIDNSIVPAVGFRLIGKKKGFNIETPINILKSLINTVYDMGIPSHSEPDMNYIEDIHVPDVSTLDFDLSDKTKLELIEAGYKAAHVLFSRIRPYTFFGFLRRVFR